jgi:exocyst complex component 4
MITRLSPQANGGTRLKTPASFADAGEIHETVRKLLLGNGDKKALIDKVCLLGMFG